MRELGEAIHCYIETLERLTKLIEKDDGSDPSRSRRLRKAYDKIDGKIDGLDAVREWD